MTALEVLDAAAVQRLMPPLEAVLAVERALRDGLDPAKTPERSRLTTPQGELLLMPARSADAVGVKLVSIAPGNAAKGLPRIQGLYVLFDEETLRPVLLLDGAALTTVRTPAVSFAAVRRALPAGRPVRAVVFGAGPQALGHLRTLAAVLAPGHAPAPRAHQTLVDAHLVARNSPAALPQLPGVLVRALRAGTAPVGRALADADLVVCATTSHHPLFEAHEVRDDVVVVAVGAHDPAALEVDPRLAGRARVVVEDPATALREAGVVRAAVEQGLLQPAALVPMSVAVRAAPPHRDRPELFVSVGMAWEDLVVASALRARSQAQD